MMKTHKIVSCTVVSLTASRRINSMPYILNFEGRWRPKLSALSPPLQSAGLPQQPFTHVAPGGLPYGSSVTSQALPGATAALPDSGILPSAHTHLQRSLNSPQRPPSTGHTGVCVSVCVGVCVFFPRFNLAFSLTYPTVL